MISHCPINLNRFRGWKIWRGWTNRRWRWWRADKIGNYRKTGFSRIASFRRARGPSCHFRRPRKSRRWSRGWPHRENRRIGSADRQPYTQPPPDSRRPHKSESLWGFRRRRKPWWGPISRTRRRQNELVLILISYFRKTLILPLLTSDTERNNSHSPGL